MGTSGAGKGSVAALLVKQFPGLCVHVERDCCIAEILIGKYKRLRDYEYGLLHAIYTANKEAMKAERDRDKANGKAQQNFQKPFNEKEQALIAAQQAWNSYCQDKGLDTLCKVHVVGEEIFNIPEAVDTLFKTKIEQAYADNSCKLIIVDTVATLYPGADRMLPECIKNSFIVHVHVQNFCTRGDGENVGGGVDQQLKVCGPFSAVHPFPEGSMIILKLLSSVSTDNNTNGIVPKCLFESAFRPHYVTGVCRTPHGNVGYKEIMEFLSYIL